MNKTWGGGEVMHVDGAYLSIYGLMVKSMPFSNFKLACKF